MENNLQPIKIVVAGSGTAGLLTSIILRRSFINAEITIISSSKIGIIGVGEGSTEHWKQFMEMCEIPLNELITETSATHKYGIRFENWSNHTPDYFHSISGVDEIFAHGYIASYLNFAENNKLATNQTSSIGLTQNKIRRHGLHQSVNQFHFDTFKLNDYLTGIAFRRHIKFIDSEIKDIQLNIENGNIESVTTSQNEKVEADFWIDATGFSRILMNKLGNTEWISFNKYLLCDSAIAFPTESDPNGQIRPYTRARAASSGWVWEIPTQERRGNGYVFSSNHISIDKAVDEVEKMTGYKIDQKRVFNFDSGYLKKQFFKNCIAVGLASSFAEPLEATSIGSTIQQARAMIHCIAAYKPGDRFTHEKYNSLAEEMMLNILTMIRLHYYSDRRDTQFWIDQANMPLNSQLEELINLWSERPPSKWDLPSNQMPMFQIPHLFHVAQGQGIIKAEPSSIVLNNLGIRDYVDIEVSRMKLARHNHELVDHRQALEELRDLD